MELAIKKPWFIGAPLAIMLLAGGYYVSLRMNFSFSEQKIESLAHYYVDFDTSMRVSSFSQTLQDQNNERIYQEFKMLYEQNSFKQVLPQAAIKIPKVIHIMWLGSKLPVEYERFVNSWYTYHPDWTILFWTDNEENYTRGSTVINSFSELEELLEAGEEKRVAIETKYLTFGNRFFYDQSRNYGERSDILKWEIVYRFGGVYVDIDFECYKPLDPLHTMYDFYTGVQPLDTNLVQLGAALYGACPYHPILQACVENIKYNQHIPQIVVKTGPLHFTKCFLTHAGKNNLLDVALPASYLYPCGYEERGTDKKNWCKTESFAIHHWAGSWLKPEGFVKRK